MKKSDAVLVFVVMLLFTSSASGLPAGAEVRAVPVANGLYLVEGLEGGNVAFLVTDEGVLVVDSGTSPEAGRLIMAEIAKKTDKPVKYLVLTHYHGDHTFGLQAFPSSTVIIAQQNTADNIRHLNEPRIRGMMEKAMPEMVAAQKLAVDKLRKKKGKDLKKEEERLQELEAGLAQLRELRFVYPAITFQTKLSVFLGGQEVEVVHLGRAHTDGDALVHFPGLNVLHTGDLLFAASYPYIGVEAGADTASWIAAIERAASWEVETVIPGHGRITDKQGLLKMAAYLSELREAVKGAIAAGKSLAEAKKMAPLPSWKGFDRERQLPMNIEAVYNELIRK
ncbi:MAG: MBL fold metallo-hydrolase [Acidobacteria bacterium]|jgi:glyoxylase-like metal-dependent hydrolase (beta-lactamase superfamily II)|nr:MBL fold metallo-hydrolase [Acidobacteriota bacterium]